MVNPAPDNPMPRSERWKGLVISHNKMSMTGAAWARKFLMKPSTFYSRYHSGWSMTRIKNTPVRPNGRWPPRIGPIIKTADCVPRKINCRHPICAAIYKEMNAQRCTYNMLSKRSGVSVGAILGLRSHGPGLFINVEACANSLDLLITTIRAKPKED